MKLFRVVGTSQVIGAANKSLAATVFRVKKTSIRQLRLFELESLLLNGGLIELSTDPPVIRHYRVQKRLLRETCGTGESLAEMMGEEA